LSGLSFGAVRQFNIGSEQFFSVGGLVQALAGDANINVLSTPQILTSDNQKAEIIVGDNIPIITSQGTTTGATLVSQIERQDIGITLRLTPQILESNLVKLDLFQEISNVNLSPPKGFDINTQGVITSKKSATTTVIVKDRQTVVIGGLMSESVTETVAKIPLLGDIPVLGWLFKSRSQSTEKRNLLIFLTPYLIRDPDELLALQQSKSRQMIEFINQQKVKDKGSRVRFLEQAINAPE
jgi:general secretion pathway protein D